MKAISKPFAAATLLIVGALFSLSSHAATIDLGQIAPGDTKSRLEGVSFGFSDTWKFEVTSKGKLTGHFVEFHDIVSMSATIGSDSYTQIIPSPLLPLAPYLLTSSIVLDPGHYTIDVSGLAGGFGSYIGTVGLTAVPVPTPVLLLGSAMLGLAGFARRRSA